MLYYDLIINKWLNNRVNESFLLSSPLTGEELDEGE